MQKKKKNLRFLCLVSVCFLLFFLCSCDKKMDRAQSGMEDSAWDDFVIDLGANMTVTPEGYYAVHDNFLYYISPDFSKNTVLCNKPECIHHDVGIENLFEYTPCDAFFLGRDMGICIDYYDGFLYVKAEDDSGYSDTIYKISLDGSEREKYYKCGQFVNGFAIYEGKVYLGEEYYTAQGKTQKVVRFPIEDPEKTETLFETDQYPEGTLNKMKFYDGNCYFYLFDPAEIKDGGKGSSVYFKIDLESKKVEELYGQSNCILDWNDYGIFAEIQEYSVYNPPKWTGRYYRIHPETGEKTELTGKDFPSIAGNDNFYSMDDRYLYFGSINFGMDTLPPEQQKISVYDYNGKLKAEIPSGDFGNHYWVLPGTERYLFIERLQDGLTSEFYYVDKEKFDGGRIEATKIEFSGRG